MNSSKHADAKLLSVINALPSVPPISGAIQSGGEVVGSCHVGAPSKTDANAEGLVPRVWKARGGVPLEVLYLEDVAAGGDARRRPCATEDKLELLRRHR